MCTQYLIQIFVRYLIKCGAEVYRHDEAQFLCCFRIGNRLAHHSHGFKYRVTLYTTDLIGIKGLSLSAVILVRIL
jgi:hypothetical protein